ncbi:hemicentin-2-like [Ornithodoros turicata]|uniref:hemicentin-2-like n=1 Tax=Ornithodoros turicata TaxID=34597 RepID=UPI0031390E73
MMLLPLTLLFLFFFSLVINGEPPLQVVRAQVDEEAKLPCDTSVSSDGSPATLTWTQNDSNAKSPFYTVTAADSRGLWNGEHWVSSAWLGKASFSSTTSSLHLRSVKPADSGVYLCTVTFHSGRRTHTALELIVGVAPSVPIIRTSNTGSPTARGTVGPFLQGDSVLLECFVEEGFPTPTLTWRRNGQVMYSIVEDVLVEGGVSSSTVLLESLSRTDLLSNISCEASNPLGGPTTTSVLVDLILPPLYAKIEIPEAPLLEGKPAVLRCYVAGYRPQVRISWELSGRPVLLPSYNKIKGNGTVATLLLTPKAEDNGKELRCIAENPALPDDWEEDLLALNVRHVPRVSASFAGGAKEGVVEEGGEVYLRCDVSANPHASHITWTKDGSPVADQQQLFLRNVSRNDAGEYVCSAANGIGGGHSAALELQVHHAPVCAPMESAIVYSRRRQELEIPCSVLAVPEVGAFRWRIRVTEDTWRELVTSVTDANRSLLRYTPTEEESVSITCLAANNLGEVSCVFSVHPQVIPEAPEQCSAVSSGSIHGADRDLIVQCSKRPLDEVPVPSHFELELYHGITGVLLANATSDGGIAGLTPLFHVLNLQEKDHLEGVVFAVTDHGRSPPADIVIPRVRPITHQVGEGSGYAAAFAPSIHVVLVTFLPGIAASRRIAQCLFCGG